MSSSVKRDREADHNIPAPRLHAFPLLQHKLCRLPKARPARGGVPSPALFTMRNAYFAVQSSSSSIWLQPTAGYMWYPLLTTVLEDLTQPWMQ